MAEIAVKLEQAGFETFLPQRDGLEFSRCLDRLLESGFPLDEATAMVSKSIFALDIYQVLVECDAVVANLNGRVPDEGTVAEAAMAWSRGKPVIGFKLDSRTAFSGQDNPLVAGLFDFKVRSTLEDVVCAARTHVPGRIAASGRQRARQNEVSDLIQLGEELWSLLQNDRELTSIVRLITRSEAKAASGERGTKDGLPTIAARSEAGAEFPRAVRVATKGDALAPCGVAQ